MEEPEQYHPVPTAFHLRSYSVSPLWSFVVIIGLVAAMPGYWFVTGLMRGWWAQSVVCLGFLAILGKVIHAGVTGQQRYTSHQARVELSGGRLTQFGLDGTELASGSLDQVERLCRRNVLSSPGKGEAYFVVFKDGSEVFIDVRFPEYWKLMKIIKAKCGGDFTWERGGVRLPY